MALFKENDLGKITVSKNAIETIISKQCQSPKLYDRIWLAQKPYIRTERIESGNELAGTELAGTELDRWNLYFSVYVKFGISITEVCTDLADAVAIYFKEHGGRYPEEIIVNVSGVKSAALVKRNMDVVIDYSLGEPGTVSGTIREE